MSGRCALAPNAVCPSIPGIFLVSPGCLPSSPSSSGTIPSPRNTHVLLASDHHARLSRRVFLWAGHGDAGLAPAIGECSRHRPMTRKKMPWAACQGRLLCHCLRYNRGRDLLCSAIYQPESPPAGRWMFPRYLRIVSMFFQYSLGKRMVAVIWNQAEPSLMVK
jgi:hypothetical protein